MTDAKRLLEHFRVQNHAVFVPADIASTGIMAKRRDDLTDVYLADLAAQAKMRLAMLDLKIRHAAVEVIS
jgi:hypothetical protein